MHVPALDILQLFYMNNTVIPRNAVINIRLLKRYKVFILYNMYHGRQKKIRQLGITSNKILIQ